MMYRFRDSVNKCWQNIHQKLHVPSDAHKHKELTMTETEPKTEIEHISEPVKKPIITMFNNNPTSTKLGWGELLRRELFSGRKEATTSLAEIPVNQPLLINLPPELFEQIFSSSIAEQSVFNPVLQGPLPTIQLSARSR